MCISKRSTEKVKLPLDGFLACYGRGKISVVDVIDVYPDLLISHHSPATNLKSRITTEKKFHDYSR